MRGHNDRAFRLRLEWKLMLNTKNDDRPGSAQPRPTGCGTGDVGVGQVPVKQIFTNKHIQTTWIHIYM